MNFPAKIPVFANNNPPPSADLINTPTSIPPTAPLHIVIPPAPTSLPLSVTAQIPLILQPPFHHHPLQSSHDSVSSMSDVGSSSPLIINGGNTLFSPQTSIETLNTSTNHISLSNCATPFSKRPSHPSQSIQLSARNSQSDSHSHPHNIMDDTDHQFESTINHRINLIINSTQTDTISSPNSDVVLPNLPLPHITSAEAMKDIQNTNNSHHYNDLIVPMNSTSTSPFYNKQPQLDKPSSIPQLADDCQQQSPNEQHPSTSPKTRTLSNTAQYQSKTAFRRPSSSAVFRPNNINQRQSTFETGHSSALGVPHDPISSMEALSNVLSPGLHFDPANLQKNHMTAQGGTKPGGSPHTTALPHQLQMLSNTLTAINSVGNTPHNAHSIQQDSSRRGSLHEFLTASLASFSRTHTSAHSTPPALSSNPTISTNTTTSNINNNLPSFHPGSSTLCPGNDFSGSLFSSGFHTSTNNTSNISSASAISSNVHASLPPVSTLIHPRRESFSTLPLPPPALQPGNIPTSSSHSLSINQNTSKQDTQSSSIFKGIPSYTPSTLSYSVFPNTGSFPPPLINPTPTTIPNIIPQSNDHFRETTTPRDAIQVTGDGDLDDIDEFSNIATNSDNTVLNQPTHSTGPQKARISQPTSSYHQQHPINTGTHAIIRKTPSGGFMTGTYHLPHDASSSAIHHTNEMLEHTEKVQKLSSQQSATQIPQTVGLPPILSRRTNTSISNISTFRTAASGETSNAINSIPRGLLTNPALSSTASLPKLMLQAPSTPPTVPIPPPNHTSNVPALLLPLLDPNALTQEQQESLQQAEEVRRQIALAREVEEAPPLPPVYPSAQKLHRTTALPMKTRHRELILQQDVDERKHEDDIEEQKYDEDTDESDYRDEYDDGDDDEDEEYLESKKRNNKKIRRTNPPRVSVDNDGENDAPRSSRSGRVTRNSNTTTTRQSNHQNTAYDPSSLTPAELQKAVEYAKGSVRKVGERGASSTAGNRALSQQSRQILLDFFFAHFANPYPTPAEMAQLVARTQLTQQQVNYFFVNQRTRLLKPAINYVLSLRRPQ